MLVIRCPKCNQGLQIADEFRGKVVRCAACGQTMQIPAPAPIPVAVASPAPRPATPSPIPAPPPPRIEPKPEAFPGLTEPAAPQRSGAALETAAQYPELGRPVEEFLPRQWWIWLAVSAALLAITTPVAILAKSANNLALAIPAIVLTVPNSGLFIFLIVATLMSIKRKVVVCEHGLLVQGLSRTSTCLWTEVRDVVFQMTGIGFSREVSVHNRQGTKIAAPLAIRRLFRLYNSICERTTPLLLPPIQQALDQGREVQFGEHIKVMPRGMFWIDKLLPWGEIDQLFWGYFVQLKRSALSVSGRQEVGPIDTALIPNLLLLLEVLEKRYHLKVERATTFFE